MKISILIPFYNASLFIERTLLSALNQSYSNIDYVLVNDGSVDDSMLKINNIINNHPRKKSVVLKEHDNNYGVSIARNTCINNATGDYIYFLDSDDELPIDAIKNLVDCNIGSFADLILGEFNVTGGKRDNFKEIKFENEIRGNKKILDSFLTQKWYDGTCNKLVKKKFLSENNITFQENIVHEDVLWSFEIAMKAELMIYCKKITYIYHLRPDSITQKMADKNFNSLIFIMNKLVEYDNIFKIHQNNKQIFNYFANVRIYFLKKLILTTTNKSKIKEMIKKINYIFSSKKYNKLSNYSIPSLFKLLPYKVPTSFAIFYLKLILCLKK